MANSVVRFANVGLVDAPFPLTLTLSLGEREPRTPLREYSWSVNFFKSLATILPLPKGEGWGEGEGRIHKPGAQVSRQFRRSVPTGYLCLSVSICGCSAVLFFEAFNVVDGNRNVIAPPGRGFTSRLLRKMLQKLHLVGNLRPHLRQERR